MIGSREAIFNLWFNLHQLEQLYDQGHHPSACPHFLDIRNKDGVLQDPTNGLYAGLVNCHTFT